MHGGFRGWERKNQPTVSGVNRLQSQSVTKKNSVGFRVSTEE
jgi:hypothetical protein